MNHLSENFELAKLLNQTSWASRLAVTLVGLGEADDLLQEAWAQTLANPPQETIESPRAWLAAILRRGASKKRRLAGRRADRERRVAREEALPSTHTLRVREEDRGILVEAVLGLPDNLREPLVLRYFDELSPSAIAEHLNIPASTVRSRLQRGLATLREQLERERGEEWRSWCLGFIPMGFEGAARTAPPKVASWVLVLLLAAVSWVGMRYMGPGSSPNNVEELAALAPGLAEEENEKALTLTSVQENGEDRVVVPSEPETESAYLPLTPEACVYVLRGLCLDGQKNPVAGVRVRVARPFTGALKGPSHSTTSGANGRFTLPIGPWSSEEVSAPHRIVMLFFESENYRSDTQRIELKAQREIGMGVVDMISAPRSVRGRVFASDGLSVSGARLLLLRDFEVEEARADYFRAALVKSRLIPIGVHGYIETDFDGRFSLQAVPAEPVRLVVFHNGHDGLLTDTLELGNEGHMDLGDLKLEACAMDRSIRGRVVPVAGERLHGAWVMARFSEDDWDSVGSGVPIVVGVDGRFCVPVPAGASCEIVAQSYDGSARSKKGLKVPAGSNDLVVKLEPLAEKKSSRPYSLDAKPRISGRVLHAGQGVSGVWITSWGLASTGKKGANVSHYASAQSGPNGRFEIAGSYPGPYRLEASFGPWEDPLVGEWGPVELSGDATDVKLELLAPGSIRGEIATPGSEPMIGTVVRAMSEGRKARTAVVGAANDFRFDGLLPGRWSLVHEATARKKSGNREPVHVDVESGVTSSAKMELAGELSCQLVGSFLINGQHPPGHWALSLTVDDKHVPAPRLRARGVFRVAPLQRGRLLWYAALRGKYTQMFHQELELEIGENQLDIDVPTGLLNLTDLPLPDEIDMEGQMDSPCCLTWKGPDGVGWTAFLFRADQGALMLKTVPAGTIQLRYQPKRSRVLPQDSPVVAEVEVLAGETVKFAWPLR
ncbi:MAG: sigma-70 family RNA polymerase sigma factor [Planctomycetes bacterium]|nr:sigma-70 family RNA polymerase sigma factor [Planctomycetota bacterium]